MISLKNMTREAHINIGSNIGDRHALIERAVASVLALSVGPGRVSAPVESEPWGFSSPHPFLNVGVSIMTDLQPEALLRALLDIQADISDAPHRAPDGSYIDRPLDIDLICMEDTVLDIPGLILPHPRMHLRPFVLLPLAELSPSWLHPLLHLTPSRLLSLLTSR